MQNRNTPRKSALAVFLVLTISSVLAAVGCGIAWKTDFRELLQIVFVEASLIFLSALIVERTLLAEANTAAHERAESLGNILAETVKSVIQTSLNDARYAAQYDIHFLPPRQSTEKNPGVTHGEIADAIRTAKWMKLFSTSALDIFELPNIVRNRHSVRQSIINRCNISQSQFEIAVLTARPGGEYATLRGKIENPSDETYISEDVRGAIRSLRQIKLGNSSGNTRLNCKWSTYDFVPQAWFLLTDVRGFAEIYHFGLSRRRPGERNSCIGGRVPILDIAAGSGLYLALNEYFDLLIDPQSDPYLEERRLNYFKIRSHDEYFENDAAWPF